MTVFLLLEISSVVNTDHLPVLAPQDSVSKETSAEASICSYDIADIRTPDISNSSDEPQNTHHEDSLANIKRVLFGPEFSNESNASCIKANQKSATSSLLDYTSSESDEDKLEECKETQSL